jgi:hypothetical protein
LDERRIAAAETAIRSLADLIGSQNQTELSAFARSAVDAASLTLARSRRSSGGQRHHSVMDISINR